MGTATSRYLSWCPGCGNLRPLSTGHYRSFFDLNRDEPHYWELCGKISYADRAQLDETVARYRKVARMVRKPKPLVYKGIKMITDEDLLMRLRRLRSWPPGILLEVEV